LLSPLSWKRGFLLFFTVFLFSFSSSSDFSETSFSLSLSERSPNNPNSLFSLEFRRVNLNNFVGADCDLLYVSLFEELSS